MDHKIKKERAEDNIYNKTEDSDVEYAIQLNRWLLKPLGFWPLNSSSTKFDKLISVVSPPVCCFLLFTFIVPSFIEICMIGKNIKSELEILGATNFCVMGTIKYIICMLRGEELKTCIDTVVNDWHNVRTKEDREIMIRNARIARLFTIACVCFMYCGEILYAVLLPLETAKILTSHNNMTVRILPYRCNFIYFDPYARPMFEIVYSMQIFSSMLMCSIATSTCSLTAKFVTHACGLCQIVMSLLENLIDDDRDSLSVIEKELDLVIVKHLHVIRFVTHVEDLLNEICLVEFLGSTINLCLIGYYLIMSWENETTIKLISFVFLWISTTFNIFIFCYISQTLTDDCHKIGEESYMIDWYRLPSTQGRSLILLIGMANRPIRLTAGKMVELSFLCFCNVMKAAMAYLNILRQVTAEI